MKKRTGSFPALRKNREGQRSRLIFFGIFEMESLQQDSPMTAMSRDSGDLPILWFDGAAPGENLREHCPAVRLLELCPPYASKTLKDADAWLEMPAEPEELLNTVNSLAAGKKD
jgi:hypothetical protein